MLAIHIGMLDQHAGISLKIDYAHIQIKKWFILCIFISMIYISDAVK